VTLTASAGIIYAVVVNTLVQLSIAAAYGLAWAAHDREKISKRFQTCPQSVAARLRIASVAASIVARVAYVVGTALLAIAAVNATRG
jgi:predicted RND superfamily exporter protein